MTHDDAQPEIFTGLILLTGIDKPGIAAKLFESLAPFAVKVLDVKQIVINHRLILTVLIGANPAHQSAIEDDLNACALSLDVDIATLFSKGQLPILHDDLVQVRITSAKLAPGELAKFTDAITTLGGNVERIQGSSIEPVVLEFFISNVKVEKLQQALSSVEFDQDTKFQII